jgi:hypothetical protein
LLKRLFRGEEDDFTLAVGDGVGVLVVALAATGLILLARHWAFSRQRVIEALQDDFHGTVTFSSFHGRFSPIRVALRRGLL